jgi:tRNA threonylcarbamoyl adenosine modification protein YjeE
VTSPTYGLVHWYDAPCGRVAHVDLYRLRGPEELDALGWDDLCRDAALLVVEWPDRAGDRLPRPHWALTLHETPDGAARRVEGTWRS